MNLAFQGNVTAPRGAEPLVISGPVCMVPETAAERTLMRHGSVSRHNLLGQPPQQQLFVPANVTPDVERRLKVTWHMTSQPKI